MLQATASIVTLAHTAHLRIVKETPAHMKTATTLTDQANQAFYDWAEGLWSYPAQRTSDNARLINDVRDELNMLGYPITR